MCPLYKLAKNIFKNKTFFLPSNPNILEHVSGNTGIFFLGLFFLIPVSKTDVPDFCVSFLGKNWGLI
jgi:Na+/H+ antiporter NhaD/arsenite permease-like protein